MRLEAVLGDITQQEVDAVVNAANQHLAGGGGVDGAIHRAAGAADLRAACAKLNGCPVGSAKATPGFRLRAKWILHTVGPRYQDGRHGEADLLASCYRRLLKLADELGARTLAIPAISTGIYGYPKKDAADVALRTLRAASTDVELVRLVAFDQETYWLYAERI